MSQDPFHEGERLVQRKTGETFGADRNSPMITDRIPGGAIPFLAQQSLLVLGLLDQDQMGCVPLVGEAGWMSATRHSMHLDLGRTISAVDERILRAADYRELVGTIALDFATRRRLRVNGRLERTSETQLTLRVAEAYPNCPKYITQRELHWLDENPERTLVEGEGTSLRSQQQATITRADVFFIATNHPKRGPDASHRGGNPGFVTCPSPTTIFFPDYPGNSLFNTLGNLEIDSRVGLLFPDFMIGEALEVTGTASATFEDHGRKRWLTITVDHWKQRHLPVTQLAEALSPFNP